MKLARFHMAIAIFMACLCTTSHAAVAKAPRILFVGNSLTYVGNLPAVFESLAGQNKHPVRVDMIARGGATLTQWLDDGSVGRAVAQRQYNLVVFQERGDDFACGFGPQVCRDSRRALHLLAGIARAHGATPILLGTYETGPSSSKELVAAESKAARANWMPYIEISTRLNRGRRQLPHADWFWKDGMHPGHDLVLLEATLLYRQIFRIMPVPHELKVTAPMYVQASRFFDPNPSSIAKADASIQGSHDYSREVVAEMIELATLR